MCRLDATLRMSWILEASPKVLHDNIKYLDQLHLQQHREFLGGGLSNQPKKKADDNVTYVENLSFGLSCLQSFLFL